MRCIITTRNGTRCSREAAEGGLGFCWQHVPVDTASKRERWKLGIAGAALVVSTVDIIIKIGELAVKYLPEFFGSGDPDQNQAKARLENILFDKPIHPSFPSSYAPGGRRVDWAALEEFVREAVWLRDLKTDIDPQTLPWIEAKFSEWYENLNDYHRSILNEDINKLSEKTSGNDDA